MMDYDFIINILIIGFYVGIALYTTFVFLGRTNDLSNLAFSLMCFNYACTSYNRTLFTLLPFYNDGLGNLGYAFLSFTFGICHAFFCHTVFNLRQIRLFSLSYVVVGGVASLIFLPLYAITYNSFFLQILFFIIAVYAAIFTVLFMIFIFINKEYKKKRQRLILFGYGFFVIVLVIIMGYYAIFSQPLYSRVVTFTFMGAVVMFAYALSRQFNDEYKRMKVAEGNLQEQIELKTAELNQSNTDLRNLINIIAHDFKDNISGVLNCFNKYTKEFSADYEQLIRRELTRLTHDMNVLLTARQGGIEQIGYDHSTLFDFSLILRSKVKLLQAKLENRGEGLKLMANIDSGIYVRADRTALDKIASNLLANAVKFTLLKGVEGPAYVNVSLTATKDNCLLTIKDNGIGIKEENREKIFEPFFREFGRLRGASGSGLGLSIVKGAVDSLEGSITVESEEGKGTTFRVILKGAEAANASLDTNIGYEGELDLERETVDEFRRTPVEGLPNILYVENDLKHIRVFCDEYGDIFNVYLALDGAEALKMLENIPRPNVIISDIYMPVLDGFGFREAISESYSEIPFVFLTALDADEIPANSFSSGAVSIWHKTGLNYELLKLQIMAFCGLAESRREQIEEAAEKYSKEKIQRIAKQFGFNMTKTHIFSYMLEGKSTNDIERLLIDEHKIGLTNGTVRRNRSEILKIIREGGYSRVKCVGSLRDFFNDFC